MGFIIGGAARRDPLVGAARSASADRWITVCVDADQSVDDLPTGGAARALVVVMSGDRPLGRFELPLPASLDPYPAEVLADEIANRFGSRLRHARGLRAAAPPRAAPRHSTSVLVCTRDRPEELRRCLAAIARLDPAPDEVLVVDNAPHGDATRQLVASLGDPIRYLHEPFPGLDRARNRGVRAARGEILLCTDDDVEVEPGWAAHLESGFADPLVMAVTGLVLPATLDSEVHRLFERAVSFNRGYQARVLDGTRVSPYAAGGMGAGASMAFRTSFLRDIGGFPEELDAGMPTASGGDTFALAEVLRRGFRIAYEPAALAWHTHRGNEADLRRALRGYGTGSVAYLAHAAATYRDPGAVLRGGRYWAAYLGAKVVRARARGIPLGLSVAEIRGAFAAIGALREARRIVADRPPIDIAEASIVASSKVDPVNVRIREQLPTLSVVVPSRGRREELVRLIQALDGQRLPDGLAELVVVHDGDTDGSIAAVRQLSTALRCTQVVLTSSATDPHHGNGAAVARNHGATRARNDVLLFLDDDVVPTHDGVLLAHAFAHAQASAEVAAIGPCPPTVDTTRATPFALTIRNWWVDHSGRLDRSEPLTFADCGTGNLSVARRSFHEVGGFALMARREDWELGYRLARHGVDLVGVPDARVDHHADIDLANGLEDRFREGRGDAAIARSHPELLAWLPLAMWDHLSSRQRSVARAALADPTRRRATGAAALRVLPALDGLGLRDRYAKVLTAAAFASYWSGVGAELGGEAEWFGLRTTSREHARPQMTLPLESVASWCAPAPGDTSDVLVTMRGQIIGVAPVIWGGVPWDRSRFLHAVFTTFAYDETAVGVVTAGRALDAAVVVSS